MQSELREAEAALEEIAACVRDAQPEMPNADRKADKRQPAGARPHASRIAEDARRILATLKGGRERLTAEAASLLDELMQARVSWFCELTFHGERGAPCSRTSTGRVVHFGGLSTPLVQEQRALLEGEQHRSILDQQRQIRELQQALSETRQQASLLLTQVLSLTDTRLPADRSGWQQNTAVP